MKNLITLSVGILVLCVMLVCKSFASDEILMQHTDAEVLGVITLINQNDIQEAQLAEQKNIDPMVLDYARMLDRKSNDHLDEARQLSQKLGLAVENNASLDQLRSESEQNLAALVPLDKTPFAQLYMADVIKRYSEALNWIDRQDAQNDSVKQFLDKIKQHMVDYFKRAQQIQGHQHIG